MILCVAGMHRSGTSLMASYLHRNGIMMGEQLLGPGKGNKLGHFEDQEILSLHKLILEDNGCNTLVPKRNLIISPENEKIAEQLIIKKLQSASASAWGWKEPRSTLFLEFWEEKLPDVKFLLMYRDPYQVIGSIYRRMRMKYLYFSPWLAPLSWLRYNEEVIKFYDKHCNCTSIVSINGFNNDSITSSEKLASALGVNLCVPYSEIYNPRHMRDEKKITSLGFPGDMWMHLAYKFYSTRIDDMYNELNSRALVSAESGV